MNTLADTKFSFPGQTNFYRGKVRDVYTIDDTILVMIVSDRISAFDVVLPRPIPYKGQVLNQLAAYFMKESADVVPSWILDVPDPSVTIGKKCNTFRVEMVIRGYLAGHAWRTYKTGERMLCGVRMPDGMKENDRFPEPIITPTTKSDHGHDQDISRDEIIKQGIVSENDYLKLEEYTRNVFKRGTEMAAQRGLLLVDTKYEFGKDGETIILIDEIHTPDSSRYFYAEGYAERQQKGEAQKQLSKEFLRQWLIENNFQGLEGQSVPVMSDEIVNSVSERYIELYEKIRGKKFVKADNENIAERVEGNVLRSLEKIRL